MNISAGKNIEIKRVGGNYTISKREEPFVSRLPIDDALVTIAEGDHLNAVTDEFNDSGVEVFSSIFGPEGSASIQNPPAITDGSLVISVVNTDGDRLDWPIWGTSDLYKDLRFVDSSSASTGAETWSIGTDLGVKISVFTGKVIVGSTSYHVVRDLKFNTVGRLVEVSAATLYAV